MHRDKNTKGKNANFWMVLPFISNSELGQSVSGGEFI